MSSHSYPPLTPQTLDAVAAVAAEGPAAGYPDRQHRLFLDTPGLVVTNAGLFVPDGPWHIAQHPNRQTADPGRLDPEVPGPAYQQLPATWAARWPRAWRRDQFGRPVHPYWQPLLRDRRIGLPTGLGALYRYGSNETVDCIIYRLERGQPAFLLVQHRGSKKWGFPGGFREPSDRSYRATAYREAAEETGLDRLHGRTTVLTRRLPMGQRDTLHAWIENTVVLVHADQEYLWQASLRPGDDALRADWYTAAHIAALPLFNTHRDYLAAAMAQLKRSLP